MAIKAVGELVQYYAPPVQNGKYSTWLPSIARNLNRIAVPLIALTVLASLPQTEAGPMAYGVCVEGCFAAAAWWCPPAVPVCVFGCLPLLYAPTP